MYTNEKPSLQMLMPVIYGGHTLIMVNYHHPDNPMVSIRVEGQDAIFEHKSFHIRRIKLNKIEGYFLALVDIGYTVK